MLFYRSLWRQVVVLCLLSACNLFAQTTETDADSWQPCPRALAASDAPALAQDRQWNLTLAPYAHHWSYSPEHRPVFLGAIDRHVNGNRFCGLALFTNSFGQPSAYGYVGQQWDNIFGNPKLFTKVSAGLIYGYRGKHKNAIAFNQLGVAPAVIPSLGYAFNPQDSAQVFLLGTAGVTFTYTHSF